MSSFKEITSKPNPQVQRGCIYAYRLSRPCGWLPGIWWAWEMAIISLFDLSHWLEVTYIPPLTGSGLMTLRVPEST